MYHIGQFTPLLDQEKDDVENISFVQNTVLKAVVNST